MTQKHPFIIEEILAAADDELDHALSSIADGNLKPAQHFNISDDELDNLEAAAQAYYGAQKFEQAAPIYAFLLHLDPARSTCWRGLGSCLHARDKFDEACIAFSHAVQNNPNDMISRVLLGESFCRADQIKEGLPHLEKALHQQATSALESKYQMRAWALMAAKGSIPPDIVFRASNDRLAQGASQSSRDQDHESQNAANTGHSSKEAENAAQNEPFSFDPERPLRVEDIRQNPDLQPLLAELGQAMGRGELSYAQVGGFSENELQGAYTAACQYAETKQYGQAMQIAGYLIFLEPRRAEFYQLVGICLHRMKQYEMALSYYRTALIYAPDDLTTQLYLAEATILSGSVDSGLQILKKFLQAEPKAPQDLQIRANALLRQFGD